MKPRPVILIAPSTARKGEEFADASISLSNRYAEAVIAAGGLPQIFPATTDKSIIAECVARCDGVLLTGGDDIDPKRYAKKLPPKLAKTLGLLEPERDEWETGLIARVFERKRPLMAICRGHQMLNVALGGTLVVDIPAEIPGALNHRQMDRKMEPVHEIKIAPGSILARVTGRQTLGVNSTHHQALGKVAPALRVTAETSDGVAEAVELKEPKRLPFLLSVQFHPERLIDRQGVFLLLFSSFVAACERRPKKNL
ncbi:MAG TPA: gamma-glutamyl-gamma-aminobutyrate hydrolase family protein [Verrucomicrobiae bacterium]|jgi:putative glutamine amidotransferase